MLSEDELADFKTLLERQLAESRNALQAIDTGTVMLDQTSVGRLSRMDAMQQQAMAQGLKDRAQRNQRRQQAALDRMQAGVFGLCCRCGDPVTHERLAADPATPFCGDCQDEIEEEKKGS
jgi:DnaK suppressor protein